MELKLIELGEYANQEYQTSGRECVIGREPSCHVRPDHGRVSNRHSRLYWQANRLMLEDLNSSLGTSLNNVELESGPVEVNDFDCVGVGPVKFLVMIAPNAEAMAERTREWVAAELEKRRETILGGSGDSNVVSPAMQTARSILDRIVEEEGHSRGSTATATEKRRHGLDVISERGVALARILDRSLVDEQEIRAFSSELEKLIEAGQSRIALNFGNVELFSSQALSTVLKALERCREAGGQLKICTVKPQVAELFRMTNAERHIEIYPDPLPALESVWPQSTQPEAENAVNGAAADIATALTEPPKASSAPAIRPATPPPVQLIVDVGRARGQSIPIRTSRFVIGRDRRCQLRPNSDTVSRVHAIIELREGKVFVRDYGTKNGTVLNGRVLLGEEAEVHDNDTLGVGVLQFKVKFRPGGLTPDLSNEDALAAWLLDQSPVDADSPTALLNVVQPVEEPSAPIAASVPSASPQPAAPEIAATPLSFGQIRHEVRHGVLIVCIEPNALDDESTVGPLRYELQTLFDQPLPRKVVLDLENVHYLSSRAVGVILAFFQHLEREGGTLRVCCVQPKILPVLDQMRLPRLIDLYASIDEAVSDPWI